MTEYLLTMMAGITGTQAVLASTGGVGLVVIAVSLAALRSQKMALRRLDERITHLSAGVSLLTNTTEDGFRGFALELARLSSTSDARPQPQSTTRQRIAAAAGHGRSVQDIAASEQVSEGEVLLHLLLDKLTPERANAEVC